MQLACWLEFTLEPPTRMPQGADENAARLPDVDVA
jgi:hypothetical protein